MPICGTQQSHDQSRRICPPSKHTSVPTGSPFRGHAALWHRQAFRLSFVEGRVQQRGRGDESHAGACKSAAGLMLLWGSQGAVCTSKMFRRRMRQKAHRVAEGGADAPADGTVLALELVPARERISGPGCSHSRGAQAHAYRCACEDGGARAQRWLALWQVV